MTGKQRFNEVKKTMRFVTKDDEWYELIYFESEENICSYKKVYKHGKANEQNTKTYKEACSLFTIDIVENTPTPDQYFLRKVEKSNNQNIYNTISDRSLVDYLKNHKEECVDAIEKLKEIVRTHNKCKIRKLAYETCVALELEGLEELEKYIKNPEIKDIKTNEPKAVDKDKTTDVKKPKPNRTNPLDKEKAIVIYLSLSKRYKDHRENITCSTFINAWKDMFECDKYNVSKESGQTVHDKQVAAFAFVKGELDDKSIEEIKIYRDTFLIYPSREVPVELKQLAQSKGVIVTLAENIDKHLSGFNVLVKESRYMTYKINEVPYGLSEVDAKKILESLPTKDELIAQENFLMETIKGDSIPIESKKRAVKKYKAPYATHEFKVFMNKFTIHKCKNKELTLLCVNLCNRVGIRNMTNEKPIVYKFCAGSGMRERNIKRTRNRRKGNAKASKKGKGKK